MATSPLFTLFPKTRLSASDFRPFSLGSKTADVAKNPKIKRQSSREERYSHDLNLYSLCSKEIHVSDGESSSSDDESDDDDVKSSSKPSSSSGRVSRMSKTSKTSSEQKRVRFRSPEKSEENENGASTSKDCDQVLENGSISPGSVQKTCDTKNGHESKKETSILKPSPKRKDPYAALTKEQILAQMRMELFSIPGDFPQKEAESSDDENNIVEASCGHSISAMNEVSGKLPVEISVEKVKISSKQISPEVEKGSKKESEEESLDEEKPREMNPEILRTLEKVVEGLVASSPKKRRDSQEKSEHVSRKIEKNSSMEPPIRSIFEQLQESPGRMVHLQRSPRKDRMESLDARCKDQEDTTKSKMVNCPICGKVIMEKSSSLKHHYEQCHTPQRTDANSSGFLPTHRHSDGTAFVKIGEDEKLSGNQCFVCYRICTDARQLRLHWQLHKVYVMEEEARLAVDSETEDLDSSREHCTLDMSVEEAEIPMNLAYDFRLDFSDNEELLYSSSSESTDDESETEIERHKLGFQAKALAMSEKMGCSKNPTEKGGRRKKKKKKSIEEGEAIDSSRRCPDCDVIFRDAVLCSQHRLHDHGTRLMYRCVREECRKVFHHHRAYRQHHRQDHRQRAFICSICNDHFSVYGQFTSHLRKKHRFLGKTHPFHCKNCSVDFPSKAMLVTHKSRNYPEKIFGIKEEFPMFPSVSLRAGHGKCLICMTDFDDYTVFDTHIDAHFVREFQCPSLNCVETTDGLQSMRKHLYQHYDESDETLTCPRCGRVSGSIKQHRWHSKICSHKCNICPRNFLIEEELYAHFMKQHFYVNLVCPFCSEVIPSIVDFVSHQRDLHFAYHALGKSVKMKPKINFHLYTEDMVQYFPELKSKFPDIANGSFGYVCLVNKIPKLWKMSPDQRQEKAMENMDKMVKDMHHSTNEQPQQRADRKRKNSDENSELTESKSAKLAPLEIKEEIKEEPRDDDDQKMALAKKAKEPKSRNEPKPKKSKAGIQTKPGKLGPKRPKSNKLIVKMNANNKLGKTSKNGMG